MRYYCEC